MYIPTWILILIIVVIAFYYFKKNRKSTTPSSESPLENIPEEEKKNWLDDENWKDIALKHIAKYKQRTGKEVPTYEEMLKLDKDEFQSWLFVRAEPEFEKEMLAEMIDHEEATHSLGKTQRDDDSDFTKLIYNVFKRDRSTEVVDVLKRMSDMASELGQDGGDLVKQSIYAKAASDYYNLGDNVKNS